MQFYQLKHENFELQRLVQNHEKVHVIDQSLGFQYDLLLDISEQWPDFVKNMDFLGQKIERSINHMPLDHDVIVEDSELMKEQIAEINNQVIRSNTLLEKMKPYVRVITYI